MNGKRVYSRDEIGRFKQGRSIKYIVIFIAIVAGLALFSQIERDFEAGDAQDRMIYESVRQTGETPDEMKVRLEAKVESLKDEVVNRLFEMECKGCEELPEGQLRYTQDPRKDHIPACQVVSGLRPLYCDSWGIGQYKISTLIEHWRLAYGEEISQVKAVTISQENDTVRELIKKVVVENEGTIWAWTSIDTEEEKKFFTDKITLIRELEDILQNKVAVK